MVIKHEELMHLIRKKCGILIPEEERDKRNFKRSELLIILAKLEIYENNLKTELKENELADKIAKRILETKLDNT